MKLLSYEGVGALLADSSEATVRRLVKAGQLPAPVVLSRRSDGRPGRVGFVSDDVERAIAALVDRARGRNSSPEAAA